MPLAGLAVKVTNGYFLIGLSAVEIDVQRNIEMLKERDWLDIPLVYTSGKRAILALEKGTPGQRAFTEAFRAWGQDSCRPPQADDQSSADIARFSRGNDSRM